MAIYSLLFSVVSGAVMVAGQTDWNPRAVSISAVACLIAWMFGSSNGLDIGRALVTHRAQNELDVFIEKANKDIEKFKTKLDRRVAEGDEWKQGTGVDDAE